MVKKVKKISDTAMSGIAYSPSMYIDFEKVSEISEVKVGDKVKVVVVGTVVRISQEKRAGEKGSASICLEKFKAELYEDNNEMEDLLDDE